MLRPLMHRRLGLLTAIGLCLWTIPAGADVVRLHSGGELRGKLVKTAAADTITLELLTGGTVQIHQADVALVVPRPLTLEEYEVKARAVADTIDAQWELAEWCRLHALAPQRQTHLTRVVELDPEHEKARTGLGHVWKDGAWVDYDEYMLARGFVKHKSKYITTQELELIEKTSEELQREHDWFPKVRLWTTWATGTHASRAQQGLTALKALDDADAAPAVARFLGEHASRDVRQLGVEILTKCGGEKSAVALAKITVRDAEPQLRYEALQGIAEEHFPKVQALFHKDLRNETNAIVCRAAIGLQRVGDERSIGPLIDALVTSHKYQVRVPGNGAPSYSFGTNGTFANPSTALPPEVEAAMRTGQMPQGAILLNSPNAGENMQSRFVTVRVDQPNADVRSALQRLTGEDFGFDERLWHLWWASKKQAGGGLSNS